MAALFCPNCKTRSNFNEQTQCQIQVDNEFFLTQVCQNCYKPVYTSRLTTSADYTILYPKIRDEASEYLPEDVRENLTEAIRSINIGNYRSCVMMTRSALQAAMRDKQASGKSLFEEINDLADRHVIPQSLKEWAHEIRSSGNLTAHPEPGKKISKEDAEQLLELAESIFEYLYIVPKKVELRRQRLSRPQVEYKFSVEP